MNVKVLLETSVRMLNKIFEYYVPENLESSIALGKRVKVNFGSGKGSFYEGVIVKIDDTKEKNITINTIKNGVEKESKIQLKPIYEVLDEISYIDDKRLQIAKWISKRYFCNVYDALKLFLPTLGVPNKEKKVFNGKQASAVCLAKSTQEIQDDIEMGAIKSEKQIKLLRYLSNDDFLFVDDVKSNLGISRAVIKTMETNGLVNIFKQDVVYEDYSKIERTSKLNPNEEQQIVIEDMKEKIKSNCYSASLLYGVTGSGKTEVYLQVIEECIKQHKTAIVLVPEISLTHQTKIRFASRFGDRIAVLHSKMTMLQKQTEYRRILKGEVDIVIGPRSALFVPIKNIGLIVIDEEHDTSYISESTPRYDTKSVATYIAYLNNACLLLGSATPEVATMYKALNNKIALYKLSKRPNSYIMPDISIVDMKEERLYSSTNISKELLDAIIHRIEKKEQSFIFINRRGFSSYVSCTACGKVVYCKNCDVALTYHKNLELLMCHYCSYSHKNDGICPNCGANNLVYKGVGTEEIVKELQEYIPNAKIARMDADTTVKRGSHEEILTNFQNNGADILVGTQMLSKGHDISNVTLVGVICADASLNGNDIFYEERGFSTLLQVIGRAGRGNKKGQAIIQAYDTQSPLLALLKQNDYLSYYKHQIEFLKKHTYPPFCDILQLEIKGKNRAQVISEANKIFNLFKQASEGLYVIYPPKSPMKSKINSKYVMSIMIKTKLNDKVYQDIYKKLAKYDKISIRGVTVSVISNPKEI